MRLVYVFAFTAALVFSVLPEQSASAQVLRLGVDVGAAFRATPEGEGVQPYFTAALNGIARTPGRLGVYGLLRPDFGARASERFRRETIAGGSSICRDSETGQFADSADCTQLNGAISAEAGLSVLGSANLRAGAGYRIGYRPQPYGSLTVGGRLVYARIEGGPRGGSAAIGLGFF